MIKRKKPYGLIILIGVMIMACSCNNYANGSQRNREQTQISQNAASQHSSLLLNMDDLKAINLAADYLKERGETVDFQETYIEYHDAGESALDDSLAGENDAGHISDYLEVRLYQIDDQTENSCEHYTVVFISGDGRVLGYYKQ